MGTVPFPPSPSLLKKCLKEILPVSSSSQIYTLIGYCPQSDYLHEELTARESLRLYGRLRGYSGDNLKKVIDYMLKAVMLEPYADKQAKILRYLAR